MDLNNRGRRTGVIEQFEQKLIQGMLSRGYSEEFRRNLIRQIEGFGSNGFPESQAASFARLVYVSAWIKCHHPAIFLAAILNSQPMGFMHPRSSWPTRWRTTWRSGRSTSIRAIGRRRSKDVMRMESSRYDLVFP